MRYLAYLMLLGLVISLSACGFQLRGTGGLPPALQVMAISGIAEDQPFYRVLIDTLERQGVQVVDGEEATAQLDFTRVETGRRIAAVGRDGRVDVYEVFLELGFDVSGSEGVRPMPGARLNVSREYSFNPADILSSEETERELFETMYREAVQMLILRLRAAGR